MARKLREDYTTDDTSKVKLTEDGINKKWNELVERLDIYGSEGVKTVALKKVFNSLWFFFFCFEITRLIKYYLMKMEI